jgi:four helix bundle protein
MGLVFWTSRKTKEVPMLKTFRSYQLALRFFASVQRTTGAPFLRDQLLRAAGSVALNLAEGYGRMTPADRRRHFTIALGSLRECQAALTMLGHSDPDLLDLADHLGGCIYKLTHA